MPIKKSEDSKKKLKFSKGDADVIATGDDMVIPSRSYHIVYLALQKRKKAE